MSFARERLTANRTYWVNPLGDDDKDGLSADTAWRRIQRAVDHIYTALDACGHTVTIQLVAPSISESVTINGPLPGGGQLAINGSGGDPAAITWTAQDAVTLTVTNSAFVILNGVRMTTTGSHGACCYVSNGAFLFLGKIEFGPTAGIHLDIDGGKVLASQDYRITGGGVAHMHANGRGMIDVMHRTITLIGTPAFSAYFVGVAFGFVKMQGVRFEGAATGARFTVHYGGAIRTGTDDPEFIPGDRPGVVARGGVVDHLGEAVRFRTVARIDADATMVLPVRHKLQDIVFRNDGDQAVTLHVGTGPGRADVIGQICVSAKGWVSADDERAIARRLFAYDAETILHFSADAWNGAAIEVIALHDSLVQFP